MTVDSLLRVTQSGERLELAGSGSWTSHRAEEIERLVDNIVRQEPRITSIDLADVRELDTFGAWLVERLVRGNSGGSEPRLSSYTAELGSMKMREEIDALRTMGRDPVEILLLPRVLALVCALPMLTLIGSLAALLGGGLVAWLYSGMAPEIFVSRFREAVSVTHFEVGAIKAPFMALVIGTVACSDGLQVKGSAESLGLQTTTSVVRSIFMVIVLDGIFAMFFASIGM